MIFMSVTASLALEQAVHDPGDLGRVRDAQRGDAVGHGQQLDAGARPGP
ncbi:MAG: hypothetical protein MZU84_08465 [Sphingobacterium sp.]|nr:hypothetical protein [Sphingobacterium sp.]